MEKVGKNTHFCDRFGMDNLTFLWYNQSIQKEISRLQVLTHVSLFIIT